MANKKKFPSNAADLRKRAEDQLQKSEAELRAILDATPFPVALVDVQDDKILFWSRSALTLFGHTAPSATEWYQMAYPDPEYRSEVIDQWKPILEKARTSAHPVNTGEYRVTCRDGSVRICELYACFLEDKLIVTFVDITERKNTDARLKSVMDEQKIILDNIGTGVLFSIYRKIIWANKTFASMFGYALDELTGRDAEIFFQDKKSYDQIGIESHAVIERGMKCIKELQLKRKDGSLFWCHMIAQAVTPGNHDDGAIWVLENVTERRRGRRGMCQ